MKRGKKYKEALKLINKNEMYEPTKAIEVIKKAAYTKFDETVDAVFVLNLDKKHTIRGTHVYDYPFGKQKKVLVFAEGNYADEARQAGADYVGGQELIDKISSGWLDFDACIATPDMMKNISKLAKILGPKGLMPNPKLGTVTTDIKKAIEEIKKGKIEYRADKAGNIHVSIGKKSMEDDKLLSNLSSIYKEILKKRPADLKGDYIKKVYISSTMSPSVKIDFVQIK